MILLICGIENMVQMNLFTKQIQTHRHREQTWITKGEKGWGRDKLGVTKKKKEIVFLLDCKLHVSVRTFACGSALASGRRSHTGHP